MKPEQQRIKIAETCGWENVRSTNPPCGYTTRYKGTPSETCVELPIPDYCNDLNAIHEAESGLTREQYNRHTDILYEIEIARIGGDVEKWRWLSSPASARAEAFLRTLEMWEEEK